MGSISRLNPNTPVTVIDEIDVTLLRLHAFLQAAVIDSEIDGDGDLYASDGLEFPVWIQVLEDKKLIIFFTYVMPGDADCDNWLERVNNMNKNIMIVQFNWTGRAIWGNYWMSYDGGLNIRHFIKMLRRFSGAFRTGVGSYQLDLEATA